MKTLVRHVLHPQQDSQLSGNIESWRAFVSKLIWDKISKNTDLQSVIFVICRYTGNINPLTVQWRFVIVVTAWRNRLGWPITFSGARAVIPEFDIKVYYNTTLLHSLPSTKQKGIGCNNYFGLQGLLQPLSWRQKLTLWPSPTTVPFLS